MAGRKSDFVLPTLDDLFSTQEMRDEQKLTRIRDIPLELIDSFPDHPFKVRDDEDMPIAWPNPGRWQNPSYFCAARWPLTSPTSCCAWTMPALPRRQRVSPSPLCLWISPPYWPISNNSHSNNRGTRKRRGSGCAVSVYPPNFCPWASFFSAILLSNLRSV